MEECEFDMSSFQLDKIRRFVKLIKEIKEDCGNSGVEYRDMYNHNKEDTDKILSWHYFRLERELNNALTELD